LQRAFVGCPRSWALAVLAGAFAAAPAPLAVAPRISASATPVASGRHRRLAVSDIVVPPLVVARSPVPPTKVGLDRKIG
jgi:hypothetical protein